MYYIKVAVFANIENLLTYKAGPEAQYKKGCRVIVPLGTKLITGIVIEVFDDPKKIDFPEAKLKSIHEFIDTEPVMSGKMIKLGLWISSYYLCAPGITLSAMLAPLYRVTSKKVVTLNTDFSETMPLTEKQKTVIDYLLGRRGKKALIEDIEKETKLRNIASVIRELEEKGALETHNRKKTEGLKGKTEEPGTGVAEEIAAFGLNLKQQEALTAITKAVDKGDFKTFLLFGITGSGKTEVYIKAAEHVISLGKQVIVLVPEIFLTPQIMERFKRRFGEEIAIYHSGLKDTERLNEWLKMKENRVKLVIGTRSAVFAPFDKLGLIVVDEEFDTSYKQDNDPRYNARDVAIYRAKEEGATVILGTASPSVETYYNAVSGKFEMLKMPARVENRPMPVVKVIDLKYDSNKINDLFLSNDLIKEMRFTLEADEQAILFINRRGFSSFVFCPKCGYREKCRSCDIPLVFHKIDKVLKCHYCDFTKPPQYICPSCGSDMFYKGEGTQKIEEVIGKFFPQKRVTRVDIDAMKDKATYFEIYKKIKEKQTDILVGTQMIAKGFDFPEVTFVGVVSIDAVLNMPDFRAEERVFQLLLQVAGRTGRGTKPGAVIIQTFTPESGAIRHVRDYSVDAFYEEQLKLRKSMGYPPFGRLIQIIISDKTKTKAEKDADKIAEKIAGLTRKHNLRGFAVLGPAEAPLSKIRDKYRYSIILKSASVKDLHFVGAEIKKEKKTIDLAVIIDPLNMM